jgi:hypothetical protein
MMSFHIPKSLDEINAMITNKVMESIHLDYKAGHALNGKPKEISKDISAFANSDGGCLVFGVNEEGHLPIGVDEGVDHKKMTRERLEQLIQSNVSPTIESLEIIQIPINDTHSIYVVAAQKSLRAPHQDRQNKRYYRRNNFRSIPMEDYEIQDIRSRQMTVPPLVYVDMETERGVFLEFVVQNIGNLAVKDLKFKFSKELGWKGTDYRQFQEGISVLPPGKKLAFYYSSINEALKENSTVEKNFSVEVTYQHPLMNRKITDSFDIDINSINNTSIIYSDIYHHSKKLEDSINKLANHVQKIDSKVETLLNIAGPTGLNVSVSTLRNLASILGKEFDPTPLSPEYCSHFAFMEVLGVNLDLAFRLEDYFRWGRDKGKIEDIEGVDEKLFQQIKKYFNIDES